MPGKVEADYADSDDGCNWLPFVRADQRVTTAVNARGGSVSGPVLGRPLAIQPHRSTTVAV